MIPGTTFDAAKIQPEYVGCSTRYTAVGDSPAIDQERKYYTGCCTPKGLCCIPGVYLLVSILFTVKKTTPGKEAHLCLQKNEQIPHRQCPMRTALEFELQI